MPGPQRSSPKHEVFASRAAPQEVSGGSQELLRSRPGDEGMGVSQDFLCAPSTELSTSQQPSEVGAITLPVLGGGTEAQKAQKAEGPRDSNPQTPRALLLATVSYCLPGRTLGELLGGTGSEETCGRRSKWRRGEGRGVQKEKEAGLSDARGQEMQCLGTRRAKQGTGASSSDSTAGSELRGCRPLGQVSTYKTPQSLTHAVASPEPGPVRLCGVTPFPLWLEGSRESPGWAERGGERG